MKFKYIIYVCFLPLFCCCSNTSKKHVNNLKAILIKYHLPNFSEDRELEIYYYGNLTVYAIPLINLNTKFDNDSNALVENKLVSSSSTYRYFVRKNDDSFGYRFETLTSENGIKLLADSFLFRNAALSYFKQDIYSRLKARYKLSSKNFDDKFGFVEKYEGITKESTDSILLYFSKDPDLMDIKFTFSKPEDSIVHSKLTKVVYKYKPFPAKTNELQLPPIYISFEFEKLKPKNEIEIVSFIERIQKKVN